MGSSSNHNLDESFDQTFDECFDQTFDETFENLCNLYGEQEKTRKRRVFIERNREAGTLNDINVLDRSPVFDDIINGQAPQVNFLVNGREYHLAYYLTDGIYPRWATFIQSIPVPQGPKAVLFAQRQEAARKDVERAFGVLQARFAIVKNPALSWDKVKIGKIMRACIILHNMIVENERDDYTQYDVSDFQQGEGSVSSYVDLTYSTDIPTNIANQMGVRTRIRDRQAHQQLKGDLVEHIWHKFGRDQDNN
uniref:DDE Tnp4 domain-containing protein n=1 Tax=Brassica oleracea var. oleracea TaxID=109376 RepID=A0A0D3DAG7_BRAOL